MNVFKGVFLIMLIFSMVSSGFCVEDIKKETVKTQTVASRKINPKARKKLLKAAWRVGSRINENPRKLLNAFHRSFFKALAYKKIRHILQSLYEMHGKVVKVKFVTIKSDTSAEFILYTDKKYLIPTSITVEPEKGKIVGLFFKLPYKKTVGIEDIKSRLEKLPGRVGFMLKKLGAESAEIGTLNGTQVFAIGSTFKLYTLAALVEKKYSWKKVISLKEESKSLPSGQLQNWPIGSKLTLYSLAVRMISESDNTATDNIIDYVGRAKIERSLEKLGHAKPKLLKPFLKTSELFKLKSSTQAAQRYLNADIEERYRILDEELPKIPLNLYSVNHKPVEINKIEWPASPRDLCNLMDYFRKKKDDTAFGIMGINPGLNISKDKFDYAGYKGGSEAGVLNMTWLLKTKKDDWYCLSASWNDEKETLESKKFFEIMQSAINFIGK
ncbi:MAG: serine hydrolase [Elusimicrobiales bacterium]|nr:serine hydrolase [Elusimicrobiales bacterium]